MRIFLSPVHDLTRRDRVRLGISFATIAVIAVGAFTTAVVVGGWGQAIIGAAIVVAFIAAFAAVITILDAYSR